MADSTALTAGLALVFLGLAVVLAVIGLITRERTQVHRSLSAIGDYRSLPAELLDELDRPFKERVVRPGLARLVRIGERLTPGSQLLRIRRRLEEAGTPDNWDVNQVLAYKVLGLGAGLAIGILIGVVLGGQPIQIITIAAGIATLGYFVPNMVVYQLSSSRGERIRRELPDALDLLTIIVEAGLAFDAALAQVARHTTGPLAAEFFRVLQEMQIGLGRSEALKAMGERTNVPELRQFVTAMVQADAFGIPIAHVLRVQAKEMRVRRTQLAEERAQKVPVKILFPLIFGVLPALMIVVLGPAAIDIIRTLTGR